MADVSAALTPTAMIPAALKPRIILAAGVLALTAIIAWSLISLREEPYRVLFANLSDRDGGAIIAALSARNIPYRFAAGGEALLIPEDQVHRMRLELASAGLPRGSSTGFELLDEQRFGMTQFQERLSYQRGLQGELTRSIESLAAVQSARVHLAIPQEGGFLRGRQTPSASVLVTLHPGRSLDANQVSGIVHLVAASIPRLEPDQVKVIDQDGGLLKQGGDEPGNLPSASQLAYEAHVESSMRERIIELLEPVVGVGNVRAQVSADMDFSETHATDELYKPNQTPQSAAVRSEQMRREADQAAGAGGIPGAVTNQPNPQPLAPINGPGQAVGPAGTVAGGAAGQGVRESLINYEVDKTVRVTRGSPGQIRRLTAGIVVNHRRSVAADGAVTMTPIEPDELERMNALVREAIGFSAERGDSINIMNSAFTIEPAVVEPELPFWKDRANIPIALEIAKHLGIALLGLITIFKVIRPALKSISDARALPPPATNAEQDSPGSLVDAVVEDQIELPPPPDVQGLGEPPVDFKRNDDVLKLARENPMAVAHIVREWMAAE